MWASIYQVLSHVAAFSNTVFVRMGSVCVRVCVCVHSPFHPCAPTRTHTHTHAYTHDVRKAAKKSL